MSKQLYRFTEAKISKQVQSQTPYLEIYLLMKRLIIILELQSIKRAQAFYTKEASH